VPNGMALSGMGVAHLMSTFSPDTTLVAEIQALRRQDVVERTVLLLDQGVKAVRLGSYSMRSTVAGH